MCNPARYTRVSSFRNFLASLVSRGFWPVRTRCSSFVGRTVFISQSRKIWCVPDSSGEDRVSRLDLLVPLYIHRQTQVAIALPARLSMLVTVLKSTERTQLSPLQQDISVSEAGYCLWLTQIRMDTPQKNAKQRAQVTCQHTRKGFLLPVVMAM
jgi:hypothetical protein